MPPFPNTQPQGHSPLNAWNTLWNSMQQLPRIGGHGGATQPAQPTPQQSAPQQYSPNASTVTAVSNPPQPSQPAPAQQGQLPASAGMASLLGQGFNPMGQASSFAGMAQATTPPASQSQYSLGDMNSMIAAANPPAPPNPMSPSALGNNMTSFLQQAGAYNPHSGQDGQPSEFRSFLNATRGIDQHGPMSGIAANWQQLHGGPTGPATSMFQNPYVFGQGGGQTFSQFMNQANQDFASSQGQETGRIGALGGIAGQQGNLAQSMTELVGAGGTPGSLQNQANLTRLQAERPLNELFSGMVGAQIQGGTQPGQALANVSGTGIPLPAMLGGQGSGQPGSGPGNPLSGPAINGQPGGGPVFGNPVPAALASHMSPQQFNALSEIYNSVTRAPGSGAQIGQGGQVSLSGVTGAPLNNMIGNVASQALSSGMPIGAVHHFLGQQFGPQAVQGWMNQQVGGSVLGLWGTGQSGPQGQSITQYLDALRQAGVNVPMSGTGLSGWLPGAGQPLY